MKKILVVEDEEELATLFQLIGEEEGFKVIYGGYRWSDVEEWLEKENIDLILLDIMLPEEDGFEICKRIRGKGYEIPIIFISALIDPTYVEKGMSVGGNAYIQKPFDLEHLLQVVRKFLK